MIKKRFLSFLTASILVMTCMLVSPSALADKAPVGGDLFGAGSANSGSAGAFPADLGAGNADSDGFFTAQYTNNTSNKIEGAFILGIFNNAGRLVYSENKAFIADAGNTAAVTFDVSPTSYPDNEYNSRVFCWDLNLVPLTAPVSLLQYKATGFIVIVNESGAFYNAAGGHFSISGDAKLRFVEVIDGIGAAYTAVQTTEKGRTIVQEEGTMTVVRNTLPNADDLRGAILPRVTSSTLDSGVELLIVTVPEGGAF